MMQAGPVRLSIRKGSFQALSNDSDQLTATTVSGEGQYSHLGPYSTTDGANHDNDQAFFVWLKIQREIFLWVPKHTSVDPMPLRMFNLT